MLNVFCNIHVAYNYVFPLLLCGAGEDGWLQRWLTLPSLVEFHRELGLSPHHTMELCCLLGAALAALAMAFRPMRCSLVFLLLWLLYLSLYKVAAPFCSACLSYRIGQYKVYSSYDRTTEDGFRYAIL